MYSAKRRFRLFRLFASDGGGITIGTGPAASGTANWVVGFDASGGTTDAETYSVAVDTNGYVYVGGQYAGSNIKFNVYNYTTTSSGTVTQTLWGKLPASTTPSSYSTFLIKYDSSGQVQWATSMFDGLYFSTNGTYGITVDGSFNVYTITNFGPGYTPSDNKANKIISFVSCDGVGGDVSYSLFGYTNPGGSTSLDTVLTKYNSNGVVQAVSAVCQTGGTSGNNPGLLFPSESATIGCRPWIDRSGNVYILTSSDIRLQAGTGRVLFRNFSNVTAANLIQYSNAFQTPLATSLSTTRGYLCKLNSSLQFQWVTQIASDISHSARVIPEAITMDICDNLYVAVSSLGGLLVESQNGSSGTPIPTLSFTSNASISNTGTNDGYVLKYSSSGNAQWVARIAGTSITTNPRALISDSNLNVYVAGTFLPSGLTGPTISSADTLGTFTTYGTLKSETSNVYQGFLVKYDSNATATLATTIGQTTNSNMLNMGLETDDPMNIYLCGTFAGTGTFRNPTTIVSGDVSTSTFGTITGVAGRDAFLASYDSSLNVRWANSISAGTLGNNDDEKNFGIAYNKVTGELYVAGSTNPGSNGVMTVRNYSSVSGGAIQQTTFGTLNVNTKSSLTKAGYLVKYT